ncbi:uncharacterized protein LOC132258198 [Phlebotomus argentipes]|uniref:uncharacterized protein LOC132258198 n=1 Tax=Phlebotomus argentipes TaxID=94469 RepID=UPI002892B215|nr:uncharacterized protein LOC132258198 [Phlebotomus argentipes]
MIVPEYINRSFFEQVLKCGFKLQDFKLLNYDIQFGCAPGENYCSTIYRVVINYQDKDGKEKRVQCIVKFLLNSDLGKQLMARSKVYEKEVDMFDRIFPKLSNIAGGTIFGPRFYYTLNDENAKIIVVEDLGEMGLKMANRQELLDFNHCELALKKLGKMHAASMILADEDPTLMNLYNFGLMEGTIEDPGLLQQCYKGTFPMLCDIVKTWPGYEDIAKKMEKLKPNIWEHFYDCAKTKLDGYRVLNHGDFWINNFLFKYDEQTRKPIDIVFVDLQFSYYSSPAHDLQYFLNNSPTLEVRENQRESLLRVYYDAFRQTLEDQKQTNIPSFGDLLEDMGKREMYGFFTATHIFPVIVMERQSEQGSGIDGLIDEEAAKDMLKIMLTGKRFAEVARSFLKHFDKMKVLDL